MNAAGPGDVDPNDLQTPTIKSQNYTTGRGGAQPFLLSFNSAPTIVLFTVLTIFDSQARAISSPTTTQTTRA